LANIKSAIKRIRSSERKRVANRIVLTSTRTHIKKARMSMKGGAADSASLETAMKALDKAAAKGVIHKNNASRRKARLMKQYNNLAKS
jgi:small subunit ribosomal protein S20